MLGYSFYHSYSRMKKLLLACTVVLGFCALGQVADAYPYHGRGGYYGHGGYYGGRGGYYRHGYYRHGGYFRPYGGYYGFYGPRPVFVDSFYFGAPLYVPPPAPYFEGRIVPQEPETRSRSVPDNSK